MRLLMTIRPSISLHKEAVGWFFNGIYYCRGTNSEIYEGVQVGDFALYCEYRYIHSNKLLTQEHLNEFAQNFRNR